MPAILIVDDEASMLDFLSLLFVGEGYEVETARSAEAARRALGAKRYDLVLCDILMPDGNGLDLLKEVKGADPNAAVIMMTAYTSTKSAIEAMKLGAYDYISKPFDVDELKIVAQKALERAELVDENVYLRRELEQKYTFNNIIGKSPRMQAIFALVERIARTTSTVLIHGESGTGKELIARAIHKRSPRAGRPFVSVNCGAIPPALVASELFGHEKGAFTGAVQRRLGRFELAEGGTIFLDEAGDLPAETQVALLRVLQERSFERIGGTKPIPVDVRIVAATNRDLDKAIAENAFRLDLYYRLSVFPIQLPPLRERAQDIPLLVEYLAQKYAAKAGKRLTAISRRTIDLLTAYDWPGNIRELQNVIQRAVILSEDTLVVDESWLAKRQRPPRSTAGVPIVPTLGRPSIAEETEMIEKALAGSHGRVAGPDGAAARLGLPRSTLESRIRSLQIYKNRFRS